MSLMTLSIPLLLGLNFCFIFLSRFHSMSLHRNRILVWLPCLGSVLCLTSVLWNIETESSLLILAIALFAASVLFSVWSIACWGIQDRTQEKAHRGVEFVTIQTLFLSLPLFVPRIETYAIGWLATSWLWGLWRASRRKSSLLSARLHWSRLVLPTSDYMFFAGLYLFYASGVVHNGEWSFPNPIPATLSYGVLLLWLASILRMCIAPLSALVEDSRTISDAEDLPYLFMQTVGFAFPAILILLDPNTGVLGGPFVDLRVWMRTASDVTSVFIAVTTIACVLSGKKTRIGLGALCLNVWTFWLASFGQMQADWMLVSAFQNFLALTLVWSLSSNIEFQNAPVGGLRILTKFLFVCIAAGWAALWPGSNLFFQLARAEAVTQVGFLGTLAFYAGGVALTLLCGRLIATAMLWGETTTEPKSGRLWLIEVVLLAGALIYLSLDLTVATSIGFDGFSVKSLLMFAAPFLVPFIIGVGSAKWFPPPPAFIVGASTRIPAKPRVAPFWVRGVQRAALLFWYSPVLMVRSSSRALAFASASAIWFTLALMAVSLLLRKGLP